MRDTQPPPTTTDAGIPVASDEHSLTVGPDGPILLQDHYLIQQMAQFNRERVPERQPHAKGSGAFGRFEVTNDVSAYTRAAVFQPDTTTDMLARFSTVAGERGSPDTWRDPRGFALKFYTTEGNYDMVGNNTPIFFMRDPMKFQHFIRSQKRRADNNLRDHDMQWDFWTLSPESAHQVTWLMGDRGIPRTWRHMNGYSSHTYMWVNPAGEKFWVRYHFITEQGIEFLTQDEADQLAASDGDYHTRDLYEAIERGECPSWALKVQIMPFEDARTYRFNPFDLTKVGPHADFPLIDVGRMTLDRNPTDYHSLPGRPPGPHRRQLQPAAGQRPEVARPQLQQGRRDALSHRLGPRLRPELQGRTAGRHRALPRVGRVVQRRGHGARRRHPPRRGRRLGPGRHSGARGARRCGPGAAGEQHRRSPAQPGDRAGPATGLRVLAQRRHRPRQPGREGRPSPTVLSHAFAL